MIFLHTHIAKASLEKRFSFSQQLLRYGTICGSGGEFVNCGVRKDGTMGTMEGSAHASWEGTHMCGTHCGSSLASEKNVCLCNGQVCKITAPDSLHK